MTLFMRVTYEWIFDYSERFLLPERFVSFFDFFSLASAKIA